MAEFQAEIRNIAKENEQRRKDESERMIYVTDVEKNSEIKGAMKRLFSLAELGVKAYNKGAGQKVLSIYELPEELLTLFLNLPGRRMGFCIISPERFAAFLDEVPNQVLVLGQKRQDLGVTGQVPTKARQLIKVTCLKSGDVLIFKDNTSANLNLEDVIKHIIKWISG